ncbi:hypothetical protein MTO96_003817 [Rhipicephalus appendiculatus]
MPALKTLVPTGTPLIGSNIGVGIPFEVVVPDPGKLMINMRSLEPGHDRWNLYRGLAWLLRRFGLDGEACVQEVALRSGLHAQDAGPAGRRCRGAVHDTQGSSQLIYSRRLLQGVQTWSNSGRVRRRLL